MFGWLFGQRGPQDPETAVAEMLMEAEDEERQGRLEREALLVAIEDQRNAHARVLYTVARQTAEANPQAALALVKQAALSKLTAQAAREERHRLSAPSEDEVAMAARLLGGMGAPTALGSKLTQALTQGSHPTPPGPIEDKGTPATDGRQEGEEGDGFNPPFLPKRGPRANGPRVA